LQRVFLIISIVFASTNLKDLRTKVDGYPKKPGVTYLFFSPIQNKVKKSFQKMIKLLQIKKAIKA